jgi:hypothetical protein
MLDLIPSLFLFVIYFVILYSCYFSVLIALKRNPRLTKETVLTLVIFYCASFFQVREYPKISGILILAFMIILAHALIGGKKREHT